jgi:hypothetical protein
MTFSFTAAGTKDQVRQQLAASEAQHRQWNNHTPLLASVYELIGAHLDHSNYAGGLIVEASGHHDTSYGQLNLSIRSLNIPAVPEEQTKDEPEPAEEPAT